MNWLLQCAAGTLHLDGFESHIAKNKSHPKGWLLFLAEDEGFEPPQTESESGVLPLHKSSIRGTVNIITAFFKKSRKICCFEENSRKNLQSD